VKRILALSILLSSTAYASPTCLSKGEARDRWPTTHLYWHGEDHCWDNRQGGRRYQIKPIPNTKPFIDKRAYIAQAEEAKPVAETKSDPWYDTHQPLKVKLIEIVPDAEASPTLPVERGDPLPSLNSPSNIGLIAVFGGAFSAILVSWLIFTRSIHYVKHCAIWTYQGTTKAGRKVLQACTRKGNKQSPVPEVNIRDLIRRVDGAGHDPHLRALSASIANPKPTPAPTTVDDSAIACWARSLRT
jgi:hypothetical protein